VAGYYSSYKISYILKNIGSLLLALILAILVWVAAILEQNPLREADYNRPISIEVVNPALGYTTIDNLPSSVHLRLRAPTDHWQQISPSNFKAVLDLSKLTDGLQEVPIQVAVSNSQIDILEQEPNQVTVNIQAEETITLPIIIDINDDPPLGYISHPPIISSKVVSVTGPTSLINQVDRAWARTSIGGARETTTKTSPVTIRDRMGVFLSGLTITPETVEITLPIEQRFDYKEVSVSVVVDGQITPGYWVNNITVTPSTVTIFGNPHVLDTIPGFVETTPINLTQATDDVIQIVPLNLPDGVTIATPDDETPGVTGVEVTVEIAAIESGKTIQRPIKQQGIRPEFDWSASPQQVDVIISGPIPVLQTLSLDQVEVIIDLFDLEPGTYKVQPQIFLPDGLTVSAVLPNLIEVTITPHQSPKPTVTPSQHQLTPTPESDDKR